MSDNDRIKILDDIIATTLNYYPSNEKKPFHQEHQVVKKGSQDKEVVDTEARKNATLNEKIF